MFKQTVEIIKKNPIPLLLIPLAYSIIELNFMKMIAPYLATNSILTAFTAQASYIGFGLIAFELIRVIFLTGYLPVIIEAVNGNQTNISSFREFLTLKAFIRILGLELVVLPILIAGLMALIIPGVVWFVFSIFAYFALVTNKNLSPIESISLSIAKSKGYRIRILIYSMVFMLISLVSQIFPILSVLADTFTTPFFYIILAIMFKEANSK